MIIATISTHQGNPTQVQITGHALFSYQDYDPLCLAVSLLSRTITRYLEKGQLIHNVIVDDGLLRWLIIDSKHPKISVAMEIFRQGLEDLAYEWPNKIDIQINEE